MNKAKYLIFLLFALSVETVFAQATYNFGIRKRQPASELPKSRSDVKPVLERRAKKTDAQASLVLRRDSEYELNGAWEMTSASAVVSQPFFDPDYDTSHWYDATVPGTVLTTLVDQGVVPDPYYGLNNLEISDSLCRTDWWYRIKFDVSDELMVQNARLLFNGINYRAEVWLNGKNLGKINGAFKRGIFDVEGCLKSVDNILAVRVSPPDNPGIAHEENSVEFGPNGGPMCLDGPTFISSEGWDWLPSMRDRDTGIWQDVRLCFDKGVIFGDTQIITDLPLPDTTKAEITVKVPVKNTSDSGKEITLHLESDCFDVARKVFLEPGEEQTFVFSPETDRQLVIENPVLWWPNGYGQPNLHALVIEAVESDSVIATRTDRYGIREMSMELAVDTEETEGLRIEYQPTNVIQKDKFMFDYTKLRDAMVPNRNTFIPRLVKGIDPRSYTVVEQNGNPYIVIKVNGQPIFCKGGNWGMDDGMKRCSRERLEPAFKLHRLENFNMIRNWTGESTEEVFYDLCDEYGMLVWNDFWMSTGDYNLLPLDFDLFLDNVTDMVRRYRNHPSIAIWCPRNEGYGEGLEKDFHRILMSEDGTRHYHGNSRVINMPGSGPWGYHDNPYAYYDYLAYGFNSELGNNSIPPYTSMRKFMAEEDLWPIGDVWYYHDYHVKGWSGWDAQLKDMDKLSAKPCEDIREFCRRADVLNYNSHKIMFEAYNHKMWSFTSGVLYWMSHPAWPSLITQTYSWDWQTFGTFFAVQKSCEPLHIQWNLDDRKMVVANASLAEHKGAKASFEVYSLSGRRLKSFSESLDIPANTRIDLSEVTLPEHSGHVLVRLQLRDSKNAVLSENDYWYNGDKYTNAPENFCDITATRLKVSVRARGAKTHVTVRNIGSVTAGLVRANIVDAETGDPILPAYASDNYFNLLPGEARTIEISCDMETNAENALAVEGVNCSSSISL